MALPQLQLAEPLIDAMVALLTANLDATIDQLNATVTDSYLVPYVSQILDFIPPPSVVQSGIPAIGVQELPAEFTDDTQFSMNAMHRYAVIAILQNADHRTLVMQLRRMVQAIATTIHADRLEGNANGSGGIMRIQGGALSVNFEETIPGPLLGDMDPTSPDAPPRSYLSWTGLVLSSTRVEIN